MISFNRFGESGLGNQLFQFACILNMSIENNCNFILPITRYNIHNTRIESVYNGKINYGVNMKISYDYVEKDFIYSKIPFTDNMNLNGYFQSELYFINNKEKIIRVFEPSLEIVNKLNKKYKLNNSVSIHVRRGDYVPNASYIKLDIEYYKNALSYVEKNAQIDNIIIMSDDINWCKNNFNDDRITFANNIVYDDLHLMSLCKHNIMANSTFSWWGSYLNKNENKIIVCPKNWLTGSLKSINDNNNIHTDNMYIIENNISI